MRTSVISLLAAASIASAQSSSAITPAPKVTGNPVAASYVAELPAKANSPLKGHIKAVTADDGVGVKFTVHFEGLPTVGGPFMYHLHEKPVPENGNCTATGAHLDPYKRGEVPICDATKPDTCQTGDNSGKYGNITAQSWDQEYVDPYSSTIPGSPAYFGNLSFVLHLSNKTRIGCANFKPVGQIQPSGTPYPSGNATYTVQPTGGVPKPTTSAPPEFTGAAVAKVAGGAGALLAAAAVLVL